MSDVLIRNMKMPKNCGCCDLCVLSNDKQTFFCTRQLGKRFCWSLVEKRQEDCPLFELPPHGRLVDADKLLADHNPNENWDYMVLECIIRNAPTVLEAST